MLAKRIRSFIPWKNHWTQQQLMDWCKSTWSPLYNYVYYRVQNKEEAEDITQEIYARTLRAFTSPDQLPPLPYLKTAALNLIRDRWRHQVVQGVQIPLESLVLGEEEKTDVVLDRVVMENLMGRLSPEQRMVLELRIVQGYSRSETALRMGKSEEAVRGLQYRAIQSLRHLIVEYFER